MNQHLPLASVLALAWVVGCSPNPRCDDDVRRRLLDECKYSFTPPSTLYCPPTGLQEVSEAQFHEYEERICRIVDPGGDTDCLRTATCADIALGKCFEDPGDGTRDVECLRACDDAAQVCPASCDDGIGYDACADCGVHCLERRLHCLERC